jgi:hypothetical protein
MKFVTETPNEIKSSMGAAAKMKSTVEVATEVEEANEMKSVMEVLTE